MIKNIIEGMTFVVLVTIVVIILLFAFKQIINTWEEERCYTLQKQSKEGYESFYITNSESEMCKEQEIIVDAPIKYQK